MAYLLCMHLRETLKDLLCEVLHKGHWQGLLVFLSLLELILKTAFTKLHYNVLNQSLLLVK